MRHGGVYACMYTLGVKSMCIIYSPIVCMFYRDELKHCLAHTEAVIDFGDDDREDHVDDGAMWALSPRVTSLHEEISRYLDDSSRGELVRDGVRVALVGHPNAGMLFVFYGKW